MSLNEDQKAHLQTQAQRDAAAFIQAFKARGRKSYGAELTDQEAKEIIQAALAGADRGNAENVSGGQREVRPIDQPQARTK